MGVQEAQSLNNTFELTGAGNHGHRDKQDRSDTIRKPLLPHSGGVSVAIRHNEAHVAEKHCEPFEEGIYFLEAQLTPLLVSKPVSVRLE